MTIETAAAASLFPFRQSQIRDLAQYLQDNPNYTCIPTMHVYGNASSGKSSLLRHLLQAPFGAPVAFISCDTILVEQLLLQRILKPFLAALPETTVAKLPQVASLPDFIAQLTLVLRADPRPHYLVLDHADHLLAEWHHLIYAFSRLQELTGGNITVVFVGKIPWERYLPHSGGKEPFLSIFFPSYTKQELASILCLYSPVPDKADFYAGFVDVLLHVFYFSSNTLTELLRLASLIFPKYHEPVLSGLVDEGDSAALYKHIQPAFKHAHAHYVEFVTSMNASPAQSFTQPSMEVDAEAQADQAPLFGSILNRPPVLDDGVSSIERLPVATRFLLLAAYLASYNPARTDGKLFGDSAPIYAQRTSRKHFLIEQCMKGPKAFPLHRLFAIFHSIADEATLAQFANLHVYTQLGTLMELNYVQRMVNEERLDEVKLRTKVNFDLIERVAKSCQFDIKAYLLEGQK